MLERSSDMLLTRRVLDTGLPIIFECTIGVAQPITDGVDEVVGAFECALLEHDLAQLAIGKRRHTGAVEATVDEGQGEVVAYAVVLRRDRETMFRTWHKPVALLEFDPERLVDLGWLWRPESSLDVETSYVLQEAKNTLT